jgi:hypothetical protein
MNVTPCLLAIYHLHIVFSIKLCITEVNEGDAPKMEQICLGLCFLIYVMRIILEFLNGRIFRLMLNGKIELYGGID